MGTRCLIHIQDEGETLVTLYRQYDGYPSNIMKRIKDFLEGTRVVNGIPVGKEDVKFINGSHDFAALFVWFMKGIQDDKWPVGNLYIYPPGTKDVGEEYTYTLRLEDDVPYVNIKGIYDGPVSEYEEK